jgi:hypothetical protein
MPLGDSACMTTRTLHVDFGTSLGQPIRTPVKVCRVNLLEGKLEFLRGYIVSFLSVRDYCEMHGYTLLQSFKGARYAVKGELTDLIVDADLERPLR